MDLWTDIARHIGETEGIAFEPERRSGIGGGCINETLCLEGSGHRYFVKLHEAGMLPMFEAEADGLKEMLAAEAIRVPRPICSGTAGGRSYLVMEYIAFGGRASPTAFGEQLARMHRRTAERFGWHRDNTIGSTPQINTRSGDWIGFWCDRRLGYQLELAARNGAPGSLIDKGERLRERLPVFFTDYRPVPSLLHGDLWGGNWDSDGDGNPVIFDPAVYYGDRETDLAMTELFGGPGAAFYSAYDATWAIDPGYGTRKTLYNLYHILNHYNLFGGGYAGQAARMTDRLLAEAG